MPSLQAPVGSLSLVLHAHLPYVRHPEYESFLEEDWLYEAITETYVPLLRMMDRLEADGVPFALTMSITPPLAEMLADPLLQQRYGKRLQDLLELAAKEADRRRGTPFAEAADFYVRELEEVREIWEGRYGRNVLKGFKRHQDEGRLCIVTCGATHGYLPLMATDEGRRAQVQVARANYRKHFDRDPDGIWLPECAYAPGLDRVLAEAGIRFFFTETHGLTFATPRPKFGHYRPVFCESGVAAFGRDPECSKQVWSADEGYPGDADYREFYRDAGWEAPEEDVRPIIHDGVRRNVGLKYHRITGKVDLQDKQPYFPSAAASKAAEHAGNFLFNRQAQLRHLNGQLGVHPHLVAPYDAELFGHWWFEGPTFLEMFFRKAAFDQQELRLTTPRQWLADNPTAQICTPAASSWGDKGFYGVWLNGDNAWIYKHLHRAEERMAELAMRYSNPTDLERRALNQAARELLLAQASDWAFIMTMKTTVPYAIKRTRDHVHNFNGLYLQVTEGRIEEGWLGELEWKNAAFQEIDYSVFRSDYVTARGAGAAVSSRFD